MLSRCLAILSVRVEIWIVPNLLAEVTERPIGRADVLQLRGCGDGLVDADVIVGLEARRFRCQARLHDAAHPGVGRLLEEAPPHAFDRASRKRGVVSEGWLCFDFRQIRRTGAGFFRTCACLSPCVRISGGDRGALSPRSHAAGHELTGFQAFYAFAGSIAIVGAQDNRRRQRPYWQLRPARPSVARKSL